jgi:hypothetical protein
VGHTDTVEISGVGQRLRRELLVDEMLGVLKTRHSEVGGEDGMNGDSWSPAKRDEMKM